MRHAFMGLGLDRVMAVIVADNTASRRVLEKLGMRSIGNPAPAEKNLRYFHIAAPIVRT